MDRFEKIKNQIVEGYYNKNEVREFGGADLIITHKGRDKSSNNDNTVYVVTKYSKELSKLIYDLMDVVNYDYFDKYELFSRFGHKANEYISLCENNDREVDLEGLLMAVENEAEVWQHQARICYFAYGSNMDLEQMNSRCPNNILLETVKVNNWRFCLDRRGYATIKEAKGSFIEGLVYLISYEDERNLDRYDGVSSGCYRKSSIDVGNGKDCLIYLSNHGNDGCNPVEGYLERIIKADDMNFSKEHINIIISLTKNKID